MVKTKYRKRPTKVPNRKRSAKMTRTERLIQDLVGVLDVMESISAEREISHAAGVKTCHYCGYTPELSKLVAGARCPHCGQSSWEKITVPSSKLAFR
jgi:predicted Zn-ribbon and HTH transcriptional regulator